MDFDNYIQADLLNFYTDASENPSLGMGGICRSSWMIQMWDCDFVTTHRPSIEYLELFALTASVLNWIKPFANKRVVIFCDNISVMQMINKSTASCGNCMVLVRFVTLECLIHNVRLYTQHVKSQDNEIADALSRNQIDRFKHLTKNMQLDNSPTKVPVQLWPMSKIWLSQ